MSKRMAEAGLLGSTRNAIGFLWNLSGDFLQARRAGRGHAMIACQARLYRSRRNVAISSTELNETQ